MLYLKHLIPQFSTIFETDAFLLNLWKFFKTCKNFPDQSAIMYGQDPITALSPSETRWTSHDSAGKAFYIVYKQFLDALAIC